MADETTQGAEEMSEFVNFTLVQYGKSLKNVVSITADNCERLSDICQVQLVGCHSHRLALAVKEFVKKDEVLIEKMNTMMTKLKSPIMSAEVRKSTPLRPFKYVVTRWLSIMDMFDRYLNINEIIDKMPKMVPFMLSPSEVYTSSPF